MSLLGARRHLMTTFTLPTYSVEGGSITTGVLLRSIIAGGWEPRLPASQTPTEGVSFQSLLRVESTLSTWTVMTGMVVDHSFSSGFGWSSDYALEVRYPSRMSFSYSFGERAGFSVLSLLALLSAVCFSSIFSQFT